VALVGIDLETPPGSHEWRIEVTEGGRSVTRLAGTLAVAPRTFAVERLTLPPEMVDLDRATERRAEAERAALLALYARASPERLWRGPFRRPLATAAPATGFGARRIINGRPRSPHVGADYAAATGTPVRAANAGRVALVAEYVFPGRLVVIDHGVGLYTAYFHLDVTTVAQGALVDAGQPIGRVGATGRVTGPHLHFAAVLGGARVDPEALLALPVPD
jgi:murein DD-endopeptidase MepM/ murein hydrolase activator NlpD